MPREGIELNLLPERLSILDEEGRCDSRLEPDMSDSQLLQIYRPMKLTRLLDERMFKLQRQGRIGTFPPGMGQEAASVGSAFAITDRDWMVPSFREPGAMLLRGWKMEQILLYYAGYEAGSIPPEGVRDLPICVPVGSQLPHAVGIAWAAKLKGDDAVTLCFLGDGATSEGDFHEAMNFASVYQAPVIFVCQNNQWAISLPVARQTRSRTLAQKALAYEMPGLQLDGNDALAVYAGVKEAVDRARQGGGPTFIEALTYRLSVHTTADDPKRYRKDEEVTSWEKKDPLVRFEKYLAAKKVLNKTEAERLGDRLEEQVQEAVERAEAQMKAEPLEIFDHTFAQMPHSLREQREELEREVTVAHPS